MPVTPRVGIAAATIIITMAVISSPRVNPQERRQHRSSTWTSRSRARRKKAAGVHEVNPMGVPRRSMVVYGAPDADDHAQEAAHGDPPQGDGRLPAARGAGEVTLPEGGLVVGRDGSVHGGGGVGGSACQGRVGSRKLTP